MQSLSRDIFFLREGEISLMLLLSILQKSGLRGQWSKHSGFDGNFEKILLSGQIYFKLFSFHQHKAYSEIHIDQNNNIAFHFSQQSEQHDLHFYASSENLWVSLTSCELLCRINVSRIHLQKPKLFWLGCFVSCTTLPELW